MLTRRIYANRIALAARIALCCGATFAASAHAAPHNYYVFLSNSVPNHPAGSISHGLNAGEANLVPTKPNACGVLIEDVGNLAWHFYGENSSPPIGSEILDDDVKVFMPLPGCGGPNPPQIQIDGQIVGPPGGAADYLLLKDGYSFRSIDAAGNVIASLGSANGTQLPNFTHRMRDPIWIQLKNVMAGAKQEVLADDGTATLPTIVSSVRTELRHMQQLLDTDQANAEAGRLSPGVAQHARDMSRAMDDVQRSLEACAEHYHEGRNQTAYIACDAARRGLVTVDERRDIFRDADSEKS